MKIMKHYLRTTVAQERLDSLPIAEDASSIYYHDSTAELARRKSRQVVVFVDA
jgi:hypothetical protein